MEEIVTLLSQILCQTATIHIYSFPNFTLEIFLAVVMFLIYAYLILEVAQIGRNTMKLRPNTILRRKVKEVNSTLSICTSIFSKYQDTFNPYTHCEGNGHNPSTHLAYKRLSSRCSSHSQMGWIMPNMVKGMTAHSSLADMKNFDCVASMTPMEFVKKEKERRLRNRELKKCFDSLTTLYDNVLERKYSVHTLQTKLDLAKETVQCGKCNADNNGTLPADAMTNSLFDLLEKMIIPSSLSNPLPFNGDMTRLVMDAGDLNLNPDKCCRDGIFETSSSNTSSSSEIIRVKAKHNVASC